MRLILALCTVLIASPSNAGVNGAMTELFNKMGGASNTSRAGAYQDQSAGYYTGGNLFARNQVFNSQLLTIQTPDYKTDCSGIDMFMGAFSHLSSERLLEALRAIGSNMASYAMMLSIETMSPTVKNILTELNDLVQKINNANVNSCELAATAVGSVWPKSNVSQGHLCKMIGTDSQYGSFSDYAAARQGCGAGGQRDGIIAGAANDPRFKNMLGTEFNLAWQAIQKNGFLKADKRLAEFFMSVSGTIVSLKEDGNYKIHTKTSLATKDSLLGAILHGGDVTIYKCADLEGDRCLKVEERTLTIAPKDGLVTRVKDLLISIQNKIYNDEALDEAEIAFLGSTRLPFYKILNVSTAYRRGASPIDVIDYAELGAIDILFQFLSEIIDVINESVDHIRLSQVDDTQLNRFQDALQKARKGIVDRRMGSFKQMEQVISIVRKTEHLEKHLLSKAGALSAEGA